MITSRNALCDQLVCFGQLLGPILHHKIAKKTTVTPCRTLLLIDWQSIGNQSAIDRPLIGRQLACTGDCFPSTHWHTRASTTSDNHCCMHVAKPQSTTAPSSSMSSVAAIEVWTMPRISGIGCKCKQSKATREQKAAHRQQWQQPTKDKRQHEAKRQRKAEEDNICQQQKHKVKDFKAHINEIGKKPSSCG